MPEKILNKKVLSVVLALVVVILLAVTWGVHARKMAKKAAWRQAQAQFLAQNVPADFDWEVYVRNYADLRNAGIDTEARAKQHWAEYGKNEGRVYQEAPEKRFLNEK